LLQKERTLNLRGKKGGGKEEKKKGQEGNSDWGRGEGLYLSGEKEKGGEDIWEKKPNPLRREPPHLPGKNKKGGKRTHTIPRDGGGGRSEREEGLEGEFS